MKFVPELEALFVTQVNQVLTVQQLTDQPVDRRQRQPGVVGDLTRGRTAAAGHHLQNSEGSLHRAAPAASLFVHAGARTAIRRRTPFALGGVLGTAHGNVANTHPLSLASLLMWREV